MAPVDLSFAKWSIAELGLLMAYDSGSTARRQLTSARRGILPPLSAATSGAGEGTPASSERIYICPMHPEVRANHPGDCRKCGMPPGPQTATALWLRKVRL